MVAKVNCGKSIRGVLSYNENKVKAGVASCIEAIGFGCDPGDLSFPQKLFRFSELTARNRITRSNAVHISLNFHPREQLDRERLAEIADFYMEKLGFAGQPYLIYEHTDAGHPHIHIATVSIREDGTNIDLNYIGRDKSEAARKACEQEFGLIRAEGRGKQLGPGLQPADLHAIRYGTVPTKAAISNIVRSVVKHYKYTSLAQLNAVLRSLNVQAVPGEPGTLQQERGGLVYRVIDELGETVGVPIKASSIYEKPTLKNLSERFDKNNRRRVQYKPRLLRTLEQVMAGNPGREQFIGSLKAEGVDVVFRENAEGHTYGVTYVDHVSGCVFNGSELGKSFSAAALVQQLVAADTPDARRNRELVPAVLARTDYQGGLAAVLKQWLRQGILVEAIPFGRGKFQYRLGHIKTDPASYFPAPADLAAYLQANHFEPAKGSTLADAATTYIAGNTTAFFPDTGLPLFIMPSLRELDRLVDTLFDYTYSSDYIPPELLREAKKRKRKRR